VWTLLKVDQKYLQSFEMRCWRRMDEMCWVDRVKNEEGLHKVKREKSILLTIKEERLT
jgi:hypothetical protein